MRLSGAFHRLNSRQNDQTRQKGKNRVDGRHGKIRRGHWRGVLAEISDRKHLTLGNKPSLSKRHTYRVLVSFTTSQSNSRRPAQLLTQTFANTMLLRRRAVIAVRPCAPPRLLLFRCPSTAPCRRRDQSMFANSGPALALDRRTLLRLAQPLAPID